MAAHFLLSPAAKTINLAASLACPSPRPRRPSPRSAGPRPLASLYAPIAVAALSFIKSRIAKGTTVQSDASPNWDDLHASFEMKRINHEEAYSLDGDCTNAAEEFFSRLRRAEAGHHHHIAGAYLLRYAQ